VKACYALHPYISHRRAGQAYRRCLTHEGIALTRDPADADAWFWHCEPWVIPSYVRAFRKYAKPPTVAVSVWETDLLPDTYAKALQHVDCIWTPSHYSAEALRQSNIHVEVIPHVVDPPAPTEDALIAMRRRIGWTEDCFYFYVVGAYGNRRKGVAETIAAFSGLFNESEARMVVKSIHPLPPDLASIPGIVEINGTLSDDEMAALHNVGDCLVSLHHSEGFGLHLAESMSLGKTVVATAHGGNIEFMTEENSLLVPCAIERLRDGDANWLPQFTSKMRWAYPDHDAARSCLTRAFRDREQLTTLRSRAALDLRAYSTEALAARVGNLARAARGIATSGS